MASAPRTALAAALGALLSLAVQGFPAAPQAQAAPVLTLLSGLLSISVAPTATLTTTGSTATGSLGTTTVIDGRLGASSYDVSVSTAGFDLVGATSSNTATHIPPSAATVRDTAVTGGTASSTSAVALPSASPIFRVTYPSSVLTVNLVSTYTMSMTLTVPAAAAAGLYTGTVTQTVA